MKKDFKFNTSQIGDSVFPIYEEQAIDGGLDYDSFASEEYHYFSKLSKLGYMNRHKGWSKELCELRQEEYRREYIEAVRAREERTQHMKRLQNDLIRSQELSRQLELSRDPDEALTVALNMIGCLLNDPDLARRIIKNLKGETA